MIYKQERHWICFHCFVFAGNFVFIIKRLCVSFICLLRLLKSTKTVHNYLNFYHLAQSDRININSIVMEMNCLYCFSRKFEPQFVLTTRLKVTLKQIIKIANNKKFGFACWRCKDGNMSFGSPILTYSPIKFKYYIKQSN